ncbi:TetR/AcrR family transcriptional regulator [Streptomyces varsoviensis]|uniref:TetR family transcriptional regulator n=1 Tax=Streptomyces varsoviensis TaxID=67373 RepID=A0ABR5IUJ3_9ACTN|nr:TetR/AcrR family transcriptional regulator [Streptomyces varsoviensis]KOG74271.1 TetR family transcriptional regulator [Streptomyces varsoviensis]
MATRTRRTERREKPLSRERIVEAAIELLDTAGEGGLTFRALAERLATGPGAIYWHVAGKDELLTAATDVIVAEAMAAAPSGATPRETIRGLALAVFDAVDGHPWIGGDLSRAPARSPMLRVFERIGRQLQALGVPHAAQFTALSALQSYILGTGGLNAANARAQHQRDPGTDRSDFINAAADDWASLDPDEYPFTRGIAEQLRAHDDRVEFVAGIDIILDGITARWAPPVGG